MACTAKWSSISLVSTAPGWATEDEAYGVKLDTEPGGATKALPGAIPSSAFLKNTSHDYKIINKMSKYYNAKPANVKQQSSSLISGRHSIYSVTALPCERSLDFPAMLCTFRQRTQTNRRWEMVPQSLLRNNVGAWSSSDMTTSVLPTTAKFWQTVIKVAPHTSDGTFPIIWFLEQTQNNHSSRFQLLKCKSLHTNADTEHFILKDTSTL